jgi:hypothetical protein
MSEKKISADAASQDKAQTYTVGQILYYVPNRSYYQAESRPLKVAKVGRDWVTLENDARFGKRDRKMEIDGGNYASPGRCYLSESDYKESAALVMAWEKLTSDIHTTFRRAGPPPHMTVEMIGEIRALIWPPQGT